MHKFSKSGKHSFLLITYGIVLFVALQNLGAVKNLLVWIFTVIQPVAYGLGFAFVINLIMNIFRRKLFYRMEQSEKQWVRKMVSPLCVFSTLIVLAAVVAAVVLLIIPQVTSAINVLIDKMPDSSEQLHNLINEKLAAYHAPQSLIDQVNNLNMSWNAFLDFIMKILDGKFESIVGTAMDATASVISGVSNVVLGLIIAIYILAKKDRFIYVLRQLVILIVPQKYQSQTFKILHLTNKSFANFLTGQLAEAFINASLCTIGLTIFRFPYAGAIGILTGITALIPIFGAWIGGGIGLLLVWVDAPDRAIWFLVFIVIMQQLDGQLLYPKIVGDSLGLPGVIVLIAVILGGSFSGIVGILFAVPLAAILYTLLKEMIDKMPNKEPDPDEISAPEPILAEIEPEPVSVPDRSANHYR